MRMMHRKSANLLVVLAEKLWGRAGISQAKKKKNSFCPHVELIFNY